MPTNALMNPFDPARDIVKVRPGDTNDGIGVHAGLTSLGNDETGRLFSTKRLVI